MAVKKTAAKKAEPKERAKAPAVHTGDTVLYVLGEEAGVKPGAQQAEGYTPKVRAAHVVVGSAEGAPNLLVYLDGENDAAVAKGNAHREGYTLWRGQVRYDGEGKEPGTWHVAKKAA